MGGKDKQRTKGNLKPSSSGSAAALISKDGTVGFVGFGGLAGSGTANLGYVPMAASDDADSAVDGEFRMVMRKLMKRDAVTKLKAVQEFTHLCKNSTSEAVETALPFWPRLFNKLALDVDYRVREATQQAMEQLVIRVGRKLAPHLRYVIGPWSCAQFDTYTVVASSAKRAFQAAFAEEKQAEAILFCRKELFEFLQDNILTQTASTLSDPKFVEEEDRETKYIRVLSSSILALGNLISVASSHAKPDMEEHFLKILKQNKFWKYARHKSPNVRGALFCVISTSCEHLPSMMSSFGSQVSQAVLSVLDDSEPALCQHLWDAVLSVLKNVTDCWRHVNIRKAVLPKLWSVLKNGGSGCAAVVFPNLLPFLSKLPPEVASDGTGFYQEFFSNMQEGLAKESVMNSPSECSAVVTAFMECLQFCLVHGLSGEQPSPAVQEYLIKQQLITLLKTTLQRKSKLAHSNLYPLAANLLSYLSTNSDSEKEDTESQHFGHILKWFWEDFSGVCMQSLKTPDGEEPSTGNMDTISRCLIFLKCPAKKTKQRRNVTFAFPSSEQIDYASETTNSTKRAERNTRHSYNSPESAKVDLETLYNGCLLDLVCNICTLCFDEITEKRLSLYLRLLSRLVPHFQSVRLMKTLLQKANKYSDSKDYVGLSEQFVKDIIFPWLNSYSREDVQCSKHSELQSTPLVFDSSSVEYLIDLFCGIVKTLSEQMQTELVSYSLQQDDSVHFLYRVLEKGLDVEVAGVIAWLRSSEASETILELSRCLVLHRDQSALSFKVFPEGDRNIVWKLLKLCIVTKRTVIKPDRHFLDKIFQHFLRIVRQTQREDELELSRLLEILQMFLTACVDNPGDIVPCTDDLLLGVFQLRLSEPFHQPTMSEQVAATWRSGLTLLSHLPSDMASSPCQTLLLRAAAVVQEKLMKIETLDRVDELVAVAMSLVKEAKLLCSVDSEEASLPQKVFLSWIPSRDELAFLREDYSKSSWLFAPLEDNKLPVLSEVYDSLTESHTAGFALTKHQKAVVFPVLLVKQIISDCSEADSQLAKETLTRDCCVHLWLEMNWLQQWCNAVMGRRDSQQESFEFCRDGCPTVYNLLLKLTVISDHIMEHVKHHDWCDNLLTEALSRSRTEGFLWCLVLGSALDSFRKLGVPFDLSVILAESSALVDEKECQTLFTVIHRVESIYELKVITEQYLTFSQEDNGESGFTCVFTVVASCLAQWFKLTKQDEPAVFEYQLTLTSVLDELLECNRKHDNFLLLNSSLENVSVCVLTLNLAVNRLLEMAVLHCSSAMTSKHWDFLLCSLAGWLQTCEENKSSLTNSLKCAVLCCQTCSLFCTVTRFFEDNISQLAKASKSQRADEANNKTECCSSQSTSWLSNEFGGYPPNLFSEWQEFFSGNLFGIVLNLFLYHADQSVKMHDERSLWLNRVSESLGLAMIHIPTATVKEHALEVSAPDITEGTSNLPLWIEDLMRKCLPLLICDLHGLKFAAYHLLSRVMAEITFTDDKETEGDKQEEDVIRSPPAGLMKLIQSTSRHITDILSDAAVPFGEFLDMTNDIEAQRISLALMLAWKLLLQFFRSMSQEKRVEYAKYIKHHKLVNSLLAVLFRLIPLKKNGLVIANECEPTIGLFSGQRAVQEMACLVYYSLCQWMPAIVRQWWNGLDKRQSAVVDKFTTTFIAPQLCQREMQLVQNSALRFDNMQVKTRPSAREVAAVYTVDEISMELVVKLAANHPLGVVSVESGKKIGVTAAQWRSWMLQMTTFLTHQNGSIMDGLVLWKRNVDKRFEGVDDCMICFSVIHGSNYSLPKLSCKTCKKKFHSACLYKWFSTSNQATCPLCRNLF